MKMTKAIIAMMAAIAASEADAGFSAPFRLDTADGTRAAVEGVAEAIAYSPRWGGAASCSVADNGVALLSGATGDGVLAWTPAGAGLHTLTHTAGAVTLEATFSVRDAGVALYFPRTATTGQDGSAGHPFEIADVDDLFALADAVATAPAARGLCYVQTADIDMASAGAFAGIGTYNATPTSGTPFTGTYDGSNFKIMNVDFTQRNYGGVFNQVDGGTIKNLMVSNITCSTFSSSANGGEWGGAIVGNADTGATLQNLVAEGTFGTAGRPATHNVAGIVTRACAGGTGTLIKDCTNNATLYGAYTKIGGICAITQYKIAGGAVTFDGCANNGDIISSRTTTGVTGYAGIIGFVDDNTVLVNCSNTGSIVNNSGANTDNDGALVGWSYGSGRTLTDNGGNSAPANVKMIGTWGNATETGFLYATVDNGVATTISGDIAAGNTYLLEGVAAPIVELAAGESVAFDTALGYALDDTGVTAAEDLVVTDETIGTVTTYTAVSETAFSDGNYRETVDGVEYMFTITNGEATIVNWEAVGRSPAISPDTEGDLVIPAFLGGCPVTVIGWCAFYGCSGLTAAIIPEGVVGIGSRAFCECRALVSITLPDTILSIGSGAFGYNSSLESFRIPQHVTYVDFTYFEGCTNLASLIVAEGNDALVSKNGVILADGGTTLLLGVPGITGECVVPDGVREISASGLYWTAFSSVILPGSLETIGDNAFRYAAVTSLEIPNSVTNIEWGAFYRSALTDLWLPARFEGQTSSMGIPDGCTIHFRSWYEGLPTDGNLYVDAAHGDDANDGRSWATAKASIQAAIDAAVDGESVVVAPGFYAPISTDDKILFILGAGGASNTAIDASLAVDPGITNRCATLGTTTNAVLRGFTLVNGSAPMGGGSYYGVLEDCVISNCAATTDGGGAYYSDLVRCTIVGNRASVSGGGTANSKVEWCRVVGNTAGLNGGGVWNMVGKRIAQSLISGNDASNGGGIYVQGGSSPIVQCTIADNRASERGGGLFMSAGVPTIVHCTITANRAASGGGAYFTPSSRLYNTILWRNTSLDGMAEDNWSTPSGNPTFYYSCTTPLPSNGSGNMAQYPLLCRFPDGTYRIAASSPCIDAGNNSYVTTYVTPGNPNRHDMLGNARIQGTRVDMGAIEGGIDGIVVCTRSEGWGDISDSFLCQLGEVASVVVSTRDAIHPLASITVDGEDWTDRAMVSDGIYRIAFEPQGDALVVARFATAVIHVSPDGDNTCDGLSWETAKRTIQGAIDASGANDVILVTNGLYSAFSAPHPLTIASIDGSECTFIDGRGAGRCATLGTNGKWSGTTLRGFTLCNGRNAIGAGACGGTLIDCVITNCQATSNGGGTYYANLERCVVVGNKASMGGGSYYGTLRNCLVAGNVSTGNGSGTYSCQLYNCTVGGNQTTGASATGSGSYSGAAYNSIFYGNSGGTGVQAYNTALDFSCVDIDPQFTTVDGRDWCLALSSPCVDAGTNIYVVGETDLAGNIRIQNGTVDMGCYESTPQSGIPLDSVTVAEGTYTYKGSSWTPQITVRAGSVTLREGAHYTLAWFDNVDAGTATVVATGVGPAFAGSVSNTFAIVPRPLAATMFSLDEVYPFTGAEVRPAPTVLEATLRADDWHVVSYANNVAPGMAALTIAGGRNYTGEVALSFAIACTEIYVAVDGDDASFGATAETPKRTLQAAIDAAHAGAAVYVSEGVYAPVNTGNKAIRVIATGAVENTIIDSGDINNWKRCVYVGDNSSCTNTVFEGFSLRNGHGNANGGGAMGGTFHRCVISNCYAPCGGGAYYAVLNNCLVYGNRADQGGGTAYCTLNNCTVSRNTAGNGGGTYYCTAFNTVVWGNSLPISVPFVNPETGETGGSTGGGDIVFRNYRGGALTCCCTEPAASGSGNISANPRFVDAANGDYRLYDTSPCLDAGSSAYAVGATDLTGNARVIGASVDMGCHEGAVELPLPGKVTGLSAGDGSRVGVVVLTWSATSNAWTYIVERAMDAAFTNAVVIQTVEAPSATVLAIRSSDTNVVSDTTYWYRVTGVNDGGSGEPSDSDSGWCLAAVSVAADSLPNAMAGVAYSATLQAAGGSGGYTWTTNTLGLPGGFALAANGTLSGTTMASGTYSFQVTATDSLGNAATRQFVLTVESNPDMRTVTFSLGEHGSRTGGGELVQNVLLGHSATAPTVRAATGWILDGWDADFSSIADDLTVNAKWRPAKPAIRVTDVTAPAAANAGDIVEVSWELSNWGNAAFSGTMAEEVRLVSATNASLVKTMSTVSFSEGIVRDGTMARTASFTLPKKGMEGEWRVVVVSALRPSVTLHATGVTSEGQGMLSVAAIPLPDLSVGGLTVSPTTFMPGDTVTVAYAVSNIGEAGPESGWLDRIALGDAAGRRVNLLTLDGTVTNRSVECVIPELVSLAGEVRVVVETDVADAIVETDDESNNVARSGVAALGRRLYVSAASDSVKENVSGGVRFTVRRSGPTTNALAIAVSLGGSPSSVTVPASVTIPAGSVSTTFYVRPVNNAAIDGTRSLAVSVSAGGFESGASAMLTIIDDEVPHIYLSLSGDTAREGDSLSGTVRRELVTDQPLTVYLTGPAASRCSYPASVTISAGIASAAFTLSVIDNDVAEAPATYTLRASCSGFTSGTATFTVEDDDVPGVVLTLAPGAVQEGGRVRAALARAETNDLSKAITVRLTASDAREIASMPSSITIPARKISTTFDIYVSDDGFVNDDREITIDGVVVIESCGCDGQPSSGDAISATLGIIDNDGPKLALIPEPAAMKEGLDCAGYLVLSHNSTLTEDLVVRLFAEIEGMSPSSATVEGEIDIPETVVIHVGETFVRIPVKTLDDGEEDGTRQLSIYAMDEAGVFASDSTWLLVTDQNMPDLQPLDVTTGTTAVVAGETVSVSFSITNTGYLAVSAGTPYAIYCVKGANGTVENDETLVCSGIADGGIAIGASLDVSADVIVPRVAGDCRFAVVLDPDDGIVELDNANNTAFSEVVSVSPSYAAEAWVNDHVFLQGSEVGISGLATWAGGETPAANVVVEIYILKGDLRWPLTALADAQGRFSATFRPTSAEAGHFVVGASFPGLEATAAQDSFDILGMRRATDEYLEWSMVVGEQKTLSTSIMNMSPVPLTGVQVEIIGVPQECEVLATIPETIAGDAYATLQVTMRATDVSGGDRYKTPTARITTQEGVVLDVPLYFYAKHPTTKLIANPVELEATMTPGVRQIVEFSVTNVGGEDSGKVEVLQPSIMWLRIVSGGEMENIAPQESATVQVELSPDDSLALNFTYMPTFAINCEFGDGIQVPCKFTPVAGTSGRMSLMVMEKYSINAGYTMPVSNASIRVSNKYSGDVVATGVSGPDGIWESGDIPAGTWRVYVTAPYHAAYEGEVTVSADRTSEKSVLMDTEAVSAYWKAFKRVDVEDVTDIDLVCEYVSTVPEPVVVIKECPDELPQLEEGESVPFRIVAVNEGWIAAQDVHLDLPELEGYEWTADRNIGLVPAGASVVVPVVLARKAEEPTRGVLRAAAATTRKTVCKFVLRIGYFWDCGWDRRWAAFPKLMGFKGCFNVCEGSDCVVKPQKRDHFPPGPGPGGGPSSGPGPLEVELGETCNPCVMGRGYALIDVILNYFTGVSSSKISEEDLRNLEEMGFTIDPELRQVFAIGKELDTSNPASQYTKEQAVEAMKQLMKSGKTINGFMAKVAEFKKDIEANYAYPQYVQTLGKVDVVFNTVSALSTLSAVVGGLDALLNPDHCSHLNLKPFIDSDGNIDEDQARLMEKTYEFEWEESIRSSRSAASSSTVRSSGAAVMNPDIPQSLWSGLLKFETYRIQLVAYHDMLRCLFKEGSSLSDPSYEQIAVCMDVLYRHLCSSGISSIAHAEFADVANEVLSAGQIAEFVSNWNAGVSAYEGEAVSSAYADIGEILRNYRIMGQTEHVARSLGYWSVGHMVKEEKPHLLAAIDGESGSVCASIKLKISQTVSMTREAFEGILEIGNSSVSSPIRDMKLVPIITDDMGNDATGLFAFDQIDAENISGESILEGGTSLGAAQTGTATIRFVPGVDAAPTTSKTYRFGGLLSYVNPFTGIPEVKEILPVAMTVNPSPRLTFDYFIQRDVLGDDPFTPDVVEPSVPAEVSLVIRNNGYGDASNVTIRTAAPQVLENTKGLMADFTLANERTALNGGRANLGLHDVALGTIPAQGQTVAQWWLTCSIQGHFKSIDPSFTHRSSFGSTEANMSLVDAVNAHLLIRSIDADGDVLPDFLINEHRGDGAPDTIVTTSGVEIPVAQASSAVCGAPNGTPAMRLSVSPRLAGWNYASCADGGNGRFEIVRVTREDGSELPLRNVWLTDRTFAGEGDPIVENRIHLVDDFAGLGEKIYMVYLTPLEANPLRVESFGGVGDGAVVDSMPDAITVTFTRPIAAETFDRTDIRVRHQGSLIDNLGALSISPADDSGRVFSIGGLRSLSVVDGTYILTVQSAQIADENGMPGESGKSVTWTVIGGEVTEPSLTSLRIAPNLGFSDDDGITSGTDFTIIGSADRDGLRAQVLGGNLASTELELWSGMLSGRDLSAPIRFTVGGSVTIVVVLTDAAGNSSKTTLPVFIDAIPLKATLSGAPEDEGTQADTITLAFSAQVLEGDVAVAQFSLTRNGEAVALEGVTLDSSDNTAFTLSGLSPLCAEVGDYTLSFNGAGVRKHSSGLAMADGPLSLVWRYVNPDRESPTVASVLFDGEAPHDAYTNVFSTVSVSFTEPVNVPDLIANGLIGRAARIDLLDATGNVTGSVAAVSPATWNAESNTLSWSIDPASVPAGQARLLLDAGLIADLVGNHLAAAGYSSASGLRAYALTEPVLAQVNAYAIPTWFDGELYVGEKTADNKGKIRHYTQLSTLNSQLSAAWSYLKSGSVDFEVPAQGCQGASVAFADMWGGRSPGLYIGTASGDILWYDEIVTSLDTARATLFACNFDGDDDDDLVVGGMDGLIRLVRLIEPPDSEESRSTRLVVRRIYVTDVLTDVSGSPLAVSNGRSAPVVADINHDGLVDIVSGDTAGNVWLFLGDDTAWNGTPIALLTNDGSLADRSRLAYGDVDHDGIEDLIVGRSDGSVALMSGAETLSPCVPFAVKAVITATSGEHGAIAPDGDTAFAGGDTPEFTITPDFGYHADDVLVDGVSVGATNVYMFAPLTTSHTIGATFAPTAYAISYTGLRGASNPNPATYTVEDAVTFAAPGEVYGWTFTGWTPAVIALGTTGAVEVAASWERVKFNVTVDGETTTHDYENVVAFTAPATWETNGMQVVTLGTTFTAPVVTNEFTVTVTNSFLFAWDIFTTNWWFATTETQHGAIEAPEAGWKPDGETLTLTAVPDDHYHFVAWTGDTEGCASTNGALSVTMDRARTIGVEFVRDVVTLAEAIDATNLVWTTGGAAEWTSEWNEDASDGLHDVRSGAIGDNNSTWLETTVEGVGTLSFFWRVSCESRLDFATVEIDGAISGRISGETGWAKETFDLTGGRHTIRWTYRKGRSGAAGEDAMWLDDVTWEPVPVPTLAEALDATNLIWTTSGNEPWDVLLGTDAWDKEACAVSGAIGDLGVSTLATAVAGPGTLTFQWRVSCEDGYDWFDFLIDGALLHTVTGEDGWKQASIAIPDGLHELTWEYWKDEMDDDGMAGADRAFLDNVSFKLSSGGQSLADPHFAMVEFRDYLEKNELLAKGASTTEFNAAALADTDGDGQNAWAEFVAMTDPTDPDDRFVADIAIGDDGAPVVTWDPDRRGERDYVIEEADEITGPYAPVDSAGEDGAAPSRFYRVKVLLP